MAEHLLQQTTEHWLSILEPADIWCAKVMNYEELMQEEGYKVLKMEIEVKTSNGLNITTTRCPIRVDGKLLNFYQKEHHYWENITNKLKKNLI